MHELGGPNPPRTPFLRVYGRLVAALETVREASYDLVLFDCAPNFGVLTRTAIVASNCLLVPSRRIGFPLRRSTTSGNGSIISSASTTTERARQRHGREFLLG
ncbi:MULTISPECIES: ParA family protein [Frankia]|uniref:ParA family protein n=1 Tax=Frankia TaxID=1854 RepID=UPI003568EF7A